MSRAVVLEILCHIYNSGRTESGEIKANISSLKDVAVVKTNEKKDIENRKDRNQGNRFFS